MSASQEGIMKPSGGGNGVNEIDPVTLEIVRNSFQAVADSMGVTVWRTAYSTIVRDARDCSAGICDREGQLVAQAELIPALSGAMHLSLKTLLKDHYPAGAIEEGDVLILNHPYYGGTHTSDITIYSPVFVDGDLICFVLSIAHHIDLGSMQVAGFANSTDLYQEGLLIPPLKFYQRGVVNETLIKILEANTRYPKDVLGDLRAQIAANKLGVREMTRLADKYGKNTIILAMQRVMEYGETLVRAEIAKIPDGRYEIEGFLDDDGVDIGNPVEIRAVIKVEGTDIVYDFTGSARQVRGGVNCPQSAVGAVLGYVTKCITGVDFPTNEGFFRPIKAILPPGSVVNPVSPAACLERHELAQKLADLLIQAFAKAMPERVPAASCANTTNWTIVYNDAIYYANLGGGFGATLSHDGMSAIQVHLSRCMAYPIEDAEINSPSFFEKVELVRDSGGAGKYRGGFGVRQDVRVLSEGILGIMSDSEEFSPNGLLGGKAGSPGRKYLRAGTSSERRLHSKTTNYHVYPGDVVSVRTPGGGGCGNPLDRDLQLVLEDVLDGKVSIESAMEDYGVMIDLRTLEVQAEETKRLRTKLRESIPG